ncbi:hypothetical protein [Sphaerisporangium sp. NPDC051011]|uniref:hypothetical protein n=1 Tax=Sphaerisporangium sp. NPDC051011 TaxID=3155792 RepID=UPI0033D3E5E2
MPIRVDMARYAGQLEQQRNAALTELAQWRAAAEQAFEERDQLQAEVAALKARLSGASGPEGAPVSGAA